MMSLLQELDHFRIPLKDVKKATNNFHQENVIGAGRYGLVYKGKLLLDSKGVVITIAAKQVDRGHRFRGEERLFLNEIKVLSSYKHENIISFVGFCDENNEKILVQEFVTYGSLDQYLSSAKLTWSERLQICLGAARGLNHLHNGVEGKSTVHCDFRSGTILLDKSWQAKLVGFGLTVPGSEGPTVVDTVGAPGYVDPDYLQTGIVTKESDVYSFGVTLFEVLCGRVAYELYKDSKQLLGPFARFHYEEGKLNEIIDPILWEQMNPNSLEAFSTIAYQCLENSRSKRPTMIKIVQKLEQILILQQEYEKALALQQVALDLKAKQEDDEGDSYKVKNLEYMKIPLQQIKLATNDFHDEFIIGRGGYGKVYKADLFHFDVQKYIGENVLQQVSMVELSGYQRRKSTVAVKRLDRRYGQGTAEFLQEISVLPYFRHPNLVSLLGFCDEGQERILVYEYASKGSLDGYIRSTDSEKNHTWAQRLQICLDAARGIEFLHNGVGEHHRIIHRDIKSSNILLCQNWVGKISDFGLSRIGPANLQATFVMTQVAGTLEYVDPQYHKTGMLTKESDVYSFGVVLVEVLSGRLAYFKKSIDDQEYLPHMAKRCFEQNTVNELVDPKLTKEFEKGPSTFDEESFPDSVSTFVAIAYKCLQVKREGRPTMRDIVEELEKALKSQVKGVEALRTSLDAIKFATNDFSDLMENKGYEKVYRGGLPHSKGRTSVVVKRLDPTVGSYGNEFYNEIAMLYSYSHNNIIPLLGFCEEASEKIVIFEDMVNGSLKEHLKSSSLKWRRRLKICVDAACGIAHIHSSDPDTQHSIHGDINSSTILLNHDWKAVISDFIISKGMGTLGYYDPVYATTGIVTHKSDVYSFGVVLFEVLSGRLAIETLKMDQQYPLHDVSNEEPENQERGANEDGQMIFLAKLVEHCFKNKILEDIIFRDIRGQIDPKSLVIFSTIAYRCLQEQIENRPTMGEVVKELEKAFECQDEWEWEQNLPRDYKKIIQMSKDPVSNTSTKKDLHSLLSSGILLHDGQLWLSISMDGVTNEMVSATKFSYKSVKWRFIQKSRSRSLSYSWGLQRLQGLDISNVNIQMKIKTEFLTPKTMYGAYLVFKFWDRRKFSSRPLYVNLKYKKAGETLNAYFAEWRAAGSKWLKIELFRFWSDSETNDFDVLLESFSRYYCGNCGMFVEGIEFQAISRMDCIENKELNDEKSFKPDLNMDRVEQMAIDCQDIIKRSESNTQTASKEDLYFLLFKGILIDKGEKLFSLSKVNGKKCHMLPAKKVIYNPSNVTLYNIKPQAQSRFAECVHILYHHEFRIKCNIETQMLSLDTTYACYLVFKLSEKCRGLRCPVKARDLLPYKKERTKIISFTSPTTVNLNKIKWIPEQREDGWMEVKVWETRLDDRHDGESIPVDLKLLSFEGTMFGLILYGIEFRPMQI
ncbi:hypothetical protein OSB04_011097 [Centaurea solstitialis]|uniref:non-specific serine/threonine protein kinase n=1 Tax=Centaurea solstitialis TaxID=347529 RepID=A0AA38T8S8_9ASTR|nr:hypothetical protein OSB04_011097 [Centaurea solstitialis]